MTYITNQVFYVGSSGGDSKLVKISTTIKDDSVAVPLPDGFSTITEDMLSQDQDLDPDAREDKGRVVTSAGSFLEVVQTFKNLSPITDAVLVDLPNSRHVGPFICSFFKPLLNNIVYILETTCDMFRARQHRFIECH